MVKQWKFNKEWVYKFCENSINCDNGRESVNALHGLENFVKAQIDNRWHKIPRYGSLCALHHVRIRSWTVTLTSLNLTKRSPFPATKQLLVIPYARVCACVCTQHTKGNIVNFCTLLMFPIRQYVEHFEHDFEHVYLSEHSKTVHLLHALNIAAPTSFWTCLPRQNILSAKTCQFQCSECFFWFQKFGNSVSREPDGGLSQGKLVEAVITKMSNSHSLKTTKVYFLLKVHLIVC